MGDSQSPTEGSHAHVLMGSTNGTQSEILKEVEQMHWGNRELAWEWKAVTINTRIHV